MPLVALDEDGNRVVAREVPEERWTEMRVRPKSRTTDYRCRWCDHPMHPKLLSASGTPYFAHNPGSECPHVGPAESLAHLRLKDRIYVAIERVNRWTAGLEVPGVDPVTGDEYEIDVLARSDRSGSAPWAYEVQLSPQSADETERRTLERQRGHSARVTWVNNRNRSWATDFPSVELGDDDWTVVNGVFDDLDVPAAPMPMDGVVDGFLRDRLWWVQGTGYIDKRAPGLGSAMARSKKVRKCNLTMVDDYCDRVSGMSDAMFLSVPSGFASWTEDEWFLFAPMAQARQHAKQPLSFVDLQAIERYPVPRRWAEPLPSQSPASE